MTDDPREPADELDQEQIEQSEIDVDDPGAPGGGDTTIQGNTDRNP